MPSKPTSSTSAPTDPRPTSTPSLKADVVSPPVPAPAPVRMVRFRNRMTQVLAVQIADAAGTLHHVEIPAAGTVDWPWASRVESYGVDVAIKIRRKLLAFEPVAKP